MSKLTHEDLIQIAKGYNGQIVNKYLKRPLTEEEIEAVVWRAEIIHRDGRYMGNCIRSFIESGGIPKMLNDYRQKNVKELETIAEMLVILQRGSMSRELLSEKIKCIKQILGLQY